MLLIHSTAHSRRLGCAPIGPLSTHFVLGLKPRIFQVAHNALQDRALPASLATALSTLRLSLSPYAPPLALPRPLPFGGV